MLGVPESPQELEGASSHRGAWIRESRIRWLFKEDPNDTGGICRPFVPVSLEGLSQTAFLCPVDSGSPHNRFGRWVAKPVGDLSGKSGQTTSCLGRRDSLASSGSRCVQPATPWRVRRTARTDS